MAGWFVNFEEFSQTDSRVGAGVAQRNDCTVSVNQWAASGEK